MENLSDSGADDRKVGLGAPVSPQSRWLGISGGLIEWDRLSLVARTGIPEESGFNSRRYSDAHDLTRAGGTPKYLGQDPTPPIGIEKGTDNHHGLPRW
jgi:hypothetical protein